MQESVIEKAQKNYLQSKTRLHIEPIMFIDMINKFKGN